MAEETKTAYKFVGMKNVGDRTSRIIVSGTSDNPEVYADKGKTVDLTEEQAADLKASGVVLRKAGEESDDSDTQEVDTKAEQQKAQVASGAQGPPADPKKSNQPGARGAQGS